MPQAEKKEYKPRKAITYKNCNYCNQPFANLIAHQRACLERPLEVIISGLEYEIAKLGSRLLYCKELWEFNKGRKGK